jgi:RNA polymerase sigma factor for flagellar operon FliA
VSRRSAADFSAEVQATAKGIEWPLNGAPRQAADGNSPEDQAPAKTADWPLDGAARQAPDAGSAKDQPVAKAVEWALDSAEDQAPANNSTLTSERDVAARVAGEDEPVAGGERASGRGTAHRDEAGGRPDREEAVAAGRRIAPQQEQVGGARVSGGGAGAGEVEDGLPASGGVVVNGAVRPEVALVDGRPGSFGVGETAGVLPGDQRTFDDVEAGIVALWRRFGDDREQGLRDRLVLHYAPLVKYVAGRVGTGLPAHVEVADLIQSGIFGLVDAIEKFEPERGLKFETYAMQRIRGAILDDLRAQDWVPRSVRGRAREVERALERLGAKLRRTPTDGELADELGLSLHELRDVYAQLQLTSVVALDELAAAGRGSTPLADILEDQEALDPVALLVDQDNRRQLAQAIEHLAERDRVVVTLYYFENLTLAEIGRVLGVTESRVCQLHTRAVLRLRAKLLEKTET